MMFGYAVTVGTQVAVGSAGYIVRFNIAGLEPFKVLQVQSQKTSTSAFSAVVKTPSTQDALAGLLNDAGSTTLAFMLTGGFLDVFLGLAAYPYDATTRIGFWYLKHATNGAAMSDVVDVPQQAEHLMDLCVLKQLELQANGKVSQYLSSEIRKERSRLGV